MLSSINFQNNESSEFSKISNIYLETHESEIL